MRYNELTNNAPVYQPNARAEDGMWEPRQWNSLREYVLIPLGSIFVVFLAILGMMLIST